MRCVPGQVNALRVCTPVCRDAVTNRLVCHAFPDVLLSLVYTAATTCLRRSHVFPQMALDRTMERMMKAKSIKARYLDVKLFPHGNHYFEVRTESVHSSLGRNPEGPVRQGDPGEDRESPFHSRPRRGTES